jgi:predicted transglutaminase-like cysteine proteinase
MRRVRIFRAIAIGMALLAPAGGHAQMLVAPLEPAGIAPAPDFSLFPFWQKVLTDMGPQPILPARASDIINTRLVKMPEIQPAPLMLLPVARLDFRMPAPAGPAIPAMMTAIADPAVTTARLPVVRAIPIGATDACGTDLRHCIVPAWTDFLATLEGSTPREQVEAVNAWANTRPYVEDITNWMVPDYWETPGEFLARGGDCEDFAITKYFSLVRLGFAPQDLHIMVVSDTRQHSFHAVLTVRLNGATLVLDNFLPQVTTQESLPWYKPIYALNAQGWHMYSMPSIQLADATITIAPLRSSP